MQTHAITADPLYEFAADVHAGLTEPRQKELPSKYLYDNVGSALFEVISVLPEYGLTRADERLLRPLVHRRAQIGEPAASTLAGLRRTGSSLSSRASLEARCIPNAVPRLEARAKCGPIQPARGGDVRIRRAANAATCNGQLRLAASGRSDQRYVTIDSARFRC